MKAAAIQANGGLEQLNVQDLPAPTPQSGEVVVHMHAAALNHLDIWIRKGRPGMNLQFPHILGSDGAGVVEAVGADIDHIREGDEVVIYPGLFCGHCERCKHGEHSECAEFAIVGVARPGTFAEKVALPAANVLPRPPHLDWKESAAVTLAHLTAWRMLHTKGQVQSGDLVLIHGIGGGVAAAALQLAVLAGAGAIVTSSSDQKLQQAQKLGAAETINYKDSDVAEAVNEITGGRGVDLVIDAVGAATFPINLDAVRKGGRITHCGITTGPEATANLSKIYWNQLNVLGSTLGSLGEAVQMLKAVTHNQLRPVMDKDFPLDQARAAQERMEEGQQFGKISLSI